MNCHHVRKLLSDHLDDLLPRRQASAITAHLSDCPACRQLRDNILRVEAAYRELPDRVCIRNSDLEQRAIQSWSTCRGGSHWGRRSVPTSWSTGFRPLFLPVPPSRKLLMGAVALAILLVTVLSLVRLRWGET